jgi:CheY-like chemotaxis protein
MLIVTDTGCGMDTSTQAHMFEPFFTTKELGKGTGLGLATVFGIVKQSGGHVEVTSKLGYGTTLTIYLPQVHTPLPAAYESLTVVEPLLSGSETVLVVEDEPQLQALVGLTLQRAGYTVLEAQNGQAALQLCAAHTGPLHLLLTDVIMPGMSGRQLSKHLAILQSPPKLLFMSGYTDEALDQHGILTPGIHLLSKPFTPDTLLRKVREVLDSKA